MLVDGDLGDDAWQRAEIGSSFRQHDPQDGVPATEETEIQVAYTSSTLYVAIHALDSEPGAIVAREMERDSSQARDDSVLILLDTFRDRRNAFAFITNPNGARSDVLVTDEGRDVNREWDGIWEVAARRTSDGWVAELAIPFSTLRFDPSQSSWGLNVQRIVSRKSETSHWAGLPRDVGTRAPSPNQERQPVYRVSLAGELRGLEGLRRSRQLNIKPFFVGSRSEEPRSDESDTEEDVGLDVKWGVTKSLALDLTYNTDFAEVEVDDQRVNLTRFPLFFPEKREFFLENAGIFEFGPAFRDDFDPTLLKVFFSRRIGLDSGEEVPIDWGARLTGRVAGWNVGVLGVLTDAVASPDRRAVPDSEFTVARVKRNLGDRSTVGAIFTGRDPTGRGPSGPGQTSVFGLDFDYKPTRKFDLSGFVAESDTPGASGDETAFGGGFGYRGRELLLSFDVLEVGTDFNPEVGFLLRRDFRRYSPAFNWLRRIERYGIRTWFFRAKADYYERANDGLMETRRLEFSPLGMRTRSEVHWRVSYLSESERLIEPFAIFPGIVIPAGRYEFDSLTLPFFTNQRKPVSFSGVLEVGDFYDGDRKSSRLTLRVRASRFWRLNTSWAHNDVDLPQGAFETDVFSQGVDVSLSPDLRINALMQYNEANNFVGLNIRFNWIYRPGADLFVVYNENWNAPSFGSRETSRRQLIVKFTYLFDF